MALGYCVQCDEIYALLERWNNCELSDREVINKIWDILEE